MERFSVAVIGGGISGVCAALASARHGQRTALVQDMPVLGGNASSAIRMHIVGASCHQRRPNARETGIIEEILLENQRRNPQHSFSMLDTILWEKCMAEPLLTLFLNTRMLAVRAVGGRIDSVRAHQSTTEKWFDIAADYFVDATGDGMLAAQAGALYAKGREGRDSYGESLAPETADGHTMGNSILFTARDMGRPMPFEKPGWAYTYTDADIPGHGAHKNGRVVEATSGYWWLELGGDDLDVIEDAEAIRDELLRTLFGVWDHLKNQDQGCDNLALDWVGFLPGKRESRRILGDYVLRQDDLVQGRSFPDDVAYGGWHLDLHPVGGFAAFGQFEEPDEETRNLKHLKNVYGIPYRCLFAREFDNLFLAGRAISVSHVAFGSTRVMGTCALVGQAVGTAAALAAQKGLTTREVGGEMPALQQALLRDDCYLPGRKLAHAANLAPHALVACSSQMPDAPATAAVDGFLRAEGDTWHAWHSAPGDAAPFLSLTWPEPVSLDEVILRFDSNCSRDYMVTLSDWWKERLLAGVPPELVRDYTLSFALRGAEVSTIAVRDNHLRFRRHRMDVPIQCDTLTLTVTATCGAPEARVFSLEAYDNSIAK